MPNDFLWNRILRYISKRERCEKEIRDYLKNISVGEGLTTLPMGQVVRPVPTENKTDEIIDKLKQLDFLNEERYTKAYVHDSFELKNKGTSRIRRELIQKGISEEIISKYLEKISKDNLSEKAEELAWKKYQFIKKLPILTIKRRLYGQLVRRGFSPEIALSAIDRVVGKR